ncbi:GyrI-like domain-containing protein [Microbacterium oryzae]|uniref:GyrI-like small molecule binding domain-containing protein n=1 Tax=Microbacterium oryzae TaxID=743009 RepID=A0A6I6DQD6_9MICO|nr:GyrI-like domain-containing protein [Microbacterium oryzae]QGU26256.1 hypothetical protein D7D94_00010 [Microbacterium oryzae]QGU28673.1 hypothetical protein D7D94_14110 [Microbacterium oryzae]
MAEKLDVRREFDGYRARQGIFRTVTVPEMAYLAVDGRGDPNTSPAFTAAVETLYPVAYALKFALRDETGLDIVVPPLEGLWHAEDPAVFTTARDKAAWEWTLLIHTPYPVDADAVERAIARAAAKRPPRIDALRWISLAEGRCVQTLHVGSFDDEGPVLERMHREAIREQGLRMTGVHHEIYLSDFRRVPAERRRTILRQPVTG